MSPTYHSRLLLQFFQIIAIFYGFFIILFEVSLQQNLQQLFRPLKKKFFQEFCSMFSKEYLKKILQAFLSIHSTDYLVMNNFLLFSETPQKYFENVLDDSLETSLGNLSRSFCWTWVLGNILNANLGKNPSEIDWIITVWAPGFCW